MSKSCFLPTMRWFPIRGRFDKGKAFTDAVVPASHKTGNNAQTPATLNASNNYFGTSAVSAVNKKFGLKGFAFDLAKIEPAVSPHKV
jgi:hypothetical protein